MENEEEEEQHQNDLIPPRNPINTWERESRILISYRSTYWK